MNEERFKYLMNTLPWNLSREDQAKATQLKKELQPLLDIEMAKLWERCKGLDKTLNEPMYNLLEAEKERLREKVKRGLL